MNGSKQPRTHKQHFCKVFESRQLTNGGRDEHLEVVHPGHLQNVVDATNMARGIFHS